MRDYKDTIWVENNSLSNIDKRELVFLKMEFWGIDCKLIFYQGDDALMFTINNTTYTVIVDDWNCSLKILAENKLGNKSGHKQHFIKDRKTNKHLEFKGNNCWDNLIRWVKNLKKNNRL